MMSVFHFRVLKRYANGARRALGITPQLSGTNCGLQSRHNRAMPNAAHTRGRYDCNKTGSTAQTAIEATVGAVQANRSSGGRRRRRPYVRVILLGAVALVGLGFVALHSAASYVRAQRRINILSSWRPT